MEKVIQEIDQNIPIKFTKSAFNEIQRLTKLESADNVLIIGVKNGGCSGFIYVFNFDKPQPGHTIYEQGAVKFAVNPLDLQHLLNLEIDYEQGLNNRGFTFNNPNASTTCGCGTSFA